jgi:DNA-binding MltR family transcriptional regulator
MPTPIQNNTDQWLKLLNAELHGTSDRSCIITAASIIDHLLLEFLRARLVPNSSSQDSLFDGANAPIGTFSSRIDLSYRVGLISSQFARDLHLIRRMRNDVAHSIVARTFADPGVADQVLHLVRSLGIDTRCPFLLTPPYEGTRGAFLVCAIVIISGLDAQVRTIDPITQQVADPVYITTFRDTARGA